MASQECNIRFCDNQKIETGNYSFSNENSTYPFANSLSTIRSKIFKATNNNDWRLTVDLGFPDKISALTLFAPLGEKLGITSEATIKLQADNVNDWVSPELDVTIDLTSDEQLIHFIETDQYYRFWSLYIDDPTNPDFISFGYIYMGDYTRPTFRTINKGFSWVHNDVTNVQKSLNGTPYFDVKTRYDTFNGLTMGLVQDSDRETMEEMYQRVGLHTPMPISLDPQTKTASDINKLTRFARFSSPLTVNHRVFEYFDISFSLEEVI